MKRFIRYILLLIAVLAILLLTVQSVSGTMTLSNSFLKLITTICTKLGISTDAWWNSSVHIRRLGHVIEYAILGLTAGIAFKKPWKAFIFCAGISLLDQFTKIFVPVRHFDTKDIPFDMAGIVVGLAVIMVVKMVVESVAVRTAENGRER